MVGDCFVGAFRAMLVDLDDNNVLIQVGCLVFDSKDILPTNFCDMVRRATAIRYKAIVKDIDTLETLQSHDQYFEAVLKWREEHP